MSTVPRFEGDGYRRLHVSIDPGSHACGVSVFTTEGRFLCGFCIKLSDGLMATARLTRLRVRFVEEWERRFGPEAKAVRCTLENLPMSRFAVLSNAAGAILSSGKIMAELPSSAYIPPSKWKAFTRQFCAGVKDPKGVAALRSIGWQYPTDTINDDVGDSILIYLSSVWYSQGVIWLGPDNWIRSWYTPKKKPGKKQKK